MPQWRSATDKAGEKVVDVVIHVFPLPDADRATLTLIIEKGHPNWMAFAVMMSVAVN